MVDEVFESLVYENASGVRTVLSDRSVSSLWEMRGRSGFSAPEVELVTQKYINGQTKIVGRIIKPRTVTVNMVVTGGSRAKRDALFFQMVEDLLDVDGGDIGKLYITRSDGSVVYLNCAYASGLMVTDQYRLFHTFSLQFYAEDPYFYSQDIIQSFSLPEEADAITLGEGLTLNGWCLDWSIITNGSGVITNPFEHAADPVYRIAGIRTNLTIVNNTIQKSLSFSGLLMEYGDVIVIDTRERQRSAYIEHADGSTTDILGNLVWTDADMSLPLVSGGNAITVSSMGASSDLEVHISMTALSA